jgi:hypothetical protein
MRQFRIPAIILAIVGAAALHSWAVVATTPIHPGLIGFNLDALGTDWMVFYGADQWVFDGRLAQIYDGNALTAYLNTSFADWLSEPLPFRPWVYPPSYLLIVLPFGKLPFLVSYGAFQALSAALLGAALWCGADRLNTRMMVLAVVLLGPAAAINVGQGQNAFLTAALLIGGLRLVPLRPWLGGAVLGAMTIKPQFALLLPVALLADRQWRAVAGFALAAVVLALASAAALGLDPWWQWFDAARSYADPASQWMAYGRLAGDSVFACLISAGVGLGTANALQAVALAVAVGLVFAAFRAPLAGDLRIAVVLAATILAAPHSSLHDAVLLAAAGALWIAEIAQSRAPLTYWLLALSLWLVPLVNPPETRPPGRLTPLLILAFIAVVFCRLRPKAAARQPAVAAG